MCRLDVYHEAGIKESLLKTVNAVPSSIVFFIEKRNLFITSFMGFKQDEVSCYGWTLVRTATLKPEILACHLFTMLLWVGTRYNGIYSNLSPQHYNFIRLRVLTMYFFV